MKNKWICIILCFGAFICLGGLHDFYLGRKGMAILKFFTMDFFLIGAIFDLILLFNNQYCTDLIDYGYQTSYAPSRTSLEPSHRISNEGIEWKSGSDKQVDWAEEVVSGTMRRAKELINNSNISSDDKDYVLNSLEASITSFDDANWWIDNRNESLKKKLYAILEDDENAKDIIKRMA